MSNRAGMMADAEHKINPLDKLKSDEPNVIIQVILFLD